MIPRQKAMLDALTAVIFANCRKLNG